MLCIMASMDQKDRHAARCLVSCSGVCKTGTAGSIRRSLLWLQAQMLGIMAGMYQKDVFALIIDPCRGAEAFMVKTLRRTTEIHSCPSTR